MKLDASEARKSTAFAQSDTLPVRPSGIFAKMPGAIFWKMSSDLRVRHVGLDEADTACSCTPPEPRACRCMA